MNRPLNVEDPWWDQFDNCDVSSKDACTIVKSSHERDNGLQNYDYCMFISFVEYYDFRNM